MAAASTPAPAREPEQKSEPEHVVARPATSLRKYVTPAVVVLLATGQVCFSDVILIDCDDQNKGLKFLRDARSVASRETCSETPVLGVCGCFA